MKKNIHILLVICLAGFPMVAMASMSKALESYSLSQGERLAGDVYVGAGSVVVAGDVAEDLSAAGGTILVSGIIESDALLTGGTVNIIGRVNDDLRAVGGTLILTGSVGGDALLAGGQITIPSGALINGDLLAAGGSLVIEGSVMGKLIFTGKDIYINGTVVGNVEISAKKIILGPQAVIGGNFKYRSTSPAIIDPGVKISGATDFQQIGKNSHADIRNLKRLFSGVLGVLLLLNVLMKLTGTLLLVFVLKRMTNWLVNGALSDFWNSVGRGFAVAVLMPICALLLAVSLIGLPVSLLMLLGYVAWTLLSVLVAPLIAGAWLYGKITKSKQVIVNWKSALLGVIALGLVGIVPVLGWAIKIIFLFSAFGMLAKAWYTHIWLNR